MIRDFLSAIVYIISPVVIMVCFLALAVLVVRDLGVALDILTVTLFVSILLFFAWDLVSDSWIQAGFLVDKMDSVTLGDVKKIDVTDTFIKL